MIEGVPKRMKIIFVSLVAAIFVFSVMFAYVFVIDGSVAEDDSKAFAYAAAFAAVFIILNAAMLLLGYIIFRRAKEQTMKRCVSCDALIAQNAEACPECDAVQPLPMNEDTYLEPKERPSVIRKK